MKHTRRTKTPMRFAALAATAALALTACGGGDEAASGDLLSQLQDEGSITVGIADENPYGFVDGDGNVTGEAPEVARKVLGELGIENIEAEVVDFGALIQGLQAGQFDMIAAGMYINADRAQQIAFSDPDYCVGEAFAVPEGNPKGLEDFQSVVDTDDVTIAILSGAVEEGYAADAGVPESKIQLFGDVNQQYESLAQDRVDAVTGTFLTVKQQVESRDGFEVVGPFTPLDADGNEVLGCGAFGFRPGNAAFCEAFNEELNSLQEAGELMPIITEFGFAEEDVQKAQELTVSDLTDGSASACSTGSGGGDSTEESTE